MQQEIVAIKMPLPPEFVVALQLSLGFHFVVLLCAPLSLAAFSRRVASDLLGKVGDVHAHPLNGASELLLSISPMTIRAFRYECLISCWGWPGQHLRCWTQALTSFCVLL